MADYERFGNTSVAYETAQRKCPQGCSLSENGQRCKLCCISGLEDHPNHDVAVKQMKNGFGGVLSFGLKADHDTYNRFVTHLKVITSAVSLGHDESLIVFLGENDERQYLYPEEFHNGFFRFSVGIEDAEDIIEDLRQAFEKENLI